MNNELININNLNITFDKKEVLKDVNFSFNDHTIYTILGFNGSGKTTLLKAIAGLIEVTESSIKISRECKISFIPDTSSLYEYLTGYEYLMFVGKLNDMDSDYLREKSTILLRDLKLYESRNKIINNYSNGMKQKLSLASAMLTSPDILLLDEPMTGTDFNSNNVIKEFLVKYSKNNLVIVTTHLFDLARDISDQIIILKDTKILREYNKSYFNDKPFKEEVENILNG